MRKNWRDFSGVKVGDKLIVEGLNKPVIIHVKNVSDDYFEDDKRIADFNKITGISIFGMFKAYFPNDPNCPKLTEES